MKLINFFGAFIVVMSLLCVMWRFLSQRVSIPCPSWLYWLVELDNPFAKACHAQTVVEHLDISSGMKMLDVGAGSGRITIPLAEKVGPYGTVTAMDMQEGMLKVIQEKAHKYHLGNIRVLHAGVGGRALEHNYYDRAVLATVLGEIPDQKAALQEIYTALKPGGILSVSEMIFDPHFQSQKSVIALAQSVGFHEKKMLGRWFAYTIQFYK
jgi:ubiquinone/menaquinone biosynthesis C-methylase UbiE